MIKSRRSKLPINKVGALAASLHIDPVHLLRMTMTEYQPETSAELERIPGSRLVTDSEQRILDIVRAESLGVDVSPRSDEESNELRAMVVKWRNRRLGDQDTDIEVNAKERVRPVTVDQNGKIERLNQPRK